MDAEIIGESEFTAGRKYLTTLSKSKLEEPCVYLISFSQDGKAEVMSEFPYFATTIKNLLKSDQVKEKIKI